MKFIYNIFLITFLIAVNSFAASISLFDINNSKFPEMSGKVFILNDKGENIPDLGKDQIIIDENGIPREIQSIDCPAPKPPSAISAVLTIDVSGSMTGEGILMAKSAAKAFLNTIPLGKSEVCLTSFDSYNYLNCDFTTDRTRLMTALEALKPNGGTDYNAALINRMFGSLLMAEKGKHKKVIVFLTDGFASGDENAIIKKSNEMNAVIYCVIIGQKAPEILKNISLKTGGEYFENIRSERDAEKCYKDILNKAQGGEPCTVRWLSQGCPDNRKVTVSIPSLNISTYDYYSVDFALLPRISILPGESIRFGGQEPGTFKNQKIKLINGKEFVKIDSITGSNPQFQILDFPKNGILLQPNAQFELTLRFLPFDSAYKFSRFTLHTNACSGNFFYASGGFYGAKSSLEVVEPNGGEKYLAGTDTNIIWRGVPLNDTVKIELSLDGGYSWKTITSKATGLKYTFSPPNAESNKCLIRVKQIESMGGKVNSFRVHTFTAKSISISPDSKYLVTAGEERNFNVYDINTGKLIKTVSSSLIYKKAKYSDDGKYLAVSVSDYSLEIYNTADWSLAKKISGETSWIDDFTFSGDSKYIASTADNYGNKKIKITDLQNSSTAFTTGSHSATINKLLTTLTGQNFISTSDDGSIKLWDFASGNELKSITGAGSFNASAISPDGSRISVSANNNSELRTYDLASSVLLNTIKIENDQFTDIAYSNDAQSIAASTQKGFIHFYSAENYDSLRSIRLNTFIVNDIEWSKDSKYLAAITNEGNLHLINFEIILQEDVSDNNFSISKAQYATSDVDFKNLRIGEIKDSVFINAFKNLSAFPLIIRKYKFISGDTAAFEYVSGADTVPANSSAKPEIRFKPQEAKQYRAVLRIYTSADSLDINILGTGTKEFFINYSKYLDFGKVAVDFPKDTLFKVFKNNMDYEINIQKIVITGPDKTSFLINGTFNKLIPENSDYYLPLRFIPNTKGTANTVIEIFSSDDPTPIKIQLIGEGISECGAESFSKFGIQELDVAKLFGDAYIKDSVLVLNQAKDHSTGGFKFYSYIPVDSGFSVSFKFSIIEPFQFDKNEYSYPGADGISIVFYDSKDIGGSSGVGMGYTGMHNAMAVELDLFANDANQIEDSKDPNGNHLAVFYIPDGDSVLSANHSDNNVLGINKDIPIIRSDGTYYYLKIDYNFADSAMHIYIDSTGEFKTLAIKINHFNIKDFIKLYENRGAYISIFGISGSSYQSHRLHNLRLCTYNNALPVHSSIEQDPIIKDFDIKYDKALQQLSIISQYTGAANIQIINETGRVIKSINCYLSNHKEAFKFPVKDLYNGFYIITVQYGDNYYHNKFIKY